jgi:hypothetical protein
MQDTAGAGARRRPTTAAWGCSAALAVVALACDGHASDVDLLSRPADAPEPEPPPREDPASPSGPGRSAVRYVVRVDGDELAGTLVHAKVLAGVRGLDAAPVDLLVLQVAPSAGCDPRAAGLHEGVEGIWLLAGLPPRGERRLGAPGDLAKVWTWRPPEGASHNLRMGGRLAVEGRDGGELRGTLEVTLPDGGRLDGPIRAPIVDCSAWTGPYPF